MMTTLDEVCFGVNFTASASPTTHTHTTYPKSSRISVITCNTVYHHAYSTHYTLPSSKSTKNSK